MKYRWLLFDADDTLFDYDAAESAALGKTFEENGYLCPDTWRLRYREINFSLFKAHENGTITPAALRTRRFELLFEEFGLPIPVAAFSKQYLSNLAGNAMLIKGALDVIRQLSPFFRMLIVTNGIADVQKPRIKKSGIMDYFEGLVISEEAGAAKPAPAFFDFAFRRMGHPPKKDVMLIGDSLTADMAGGINYGIDTCWYNRKKTVNDTILNITHEISDLFALFEIVGCTGCENTS